MDVQDEGPYFGGARVCLLPGTEEEEVRGPTVGSGQLSPGQLGTQTIELGTIEPRKNWDSKHNKG